MTSPFCLKLLGTHVYVNRLSVWLIPPQPPKHHRLLFTKNCALASTSVATVGAFPTVGFCRPQEPTVRRALTVATCFLFSPFAPLRLLRASTCFYLARAAIVRSGAVRPTLLYLRG